MAIMLIWFEFRIKKAVNVSNVEIEHLHETIDSLHVNNQIFDSVNIVTLNQIIENQKKIASLKDKLSTNKIDTLGFQESIDFLKEFIQ